MKKLAKQLPILAILAVVGLTSSAALAGNMKDSGSMDLTYAKRDVQPIADADGHMLMLSEAVGTDKNTSGSEYLDGFSASIREIVDLSQGNGPEQGYVIFSKGGDQQIVKFNGLINTTMKDGHPNTSMHGKWSIVKAAGGLAGIQGDGTYAGYFTAEDKFHVDWEGWHSQPQSLATTK